MTIGPYGLEYLVHVNRIVDDNLVVFDFAVGDIGLAIELVLPKPQFEDFCAQYNVRFLDAAETAAIDAEKAEWRTATPYRSA